MVIVKRTLAAAYPAVATSGFVDIGIGYVVGVTLRALDLVSVPSPTLPVFALSFASSTNAACAPPTYVFRGERMAMNAVGSFMPVASATAHVLVVSDWFQVSRIDAVRRSASVVKLQAFRDSSDQEFINQPVRAVALLSPATLSISPADRPSPEPALVRLSVWDKFIQQLFNRLGAVDRIGSWHSGNLDFPGCRAGDASNVYPPTYHNHREAQCKA